MARQPAGRGSARESQAPLEAADDEELPDDLEDTDDSDDVDDIEDTDETDLDDGYDEQTRRSAAMDEFWEAVRVEPVEIALPAGVGFTLRAYRMSTEVEPPEIDERDEDDELVPLAVQEEDDDEASIDEEELTRLALAAGRRSRRRDARDADTEDTDDVEDVDEDEDDLDLDREERGGAADEDAEDTEDAEDEEPAAPEEVPVFLARRGKVLLFRSAEGLVGYVRGAGEHDLAQLDTWPQVRERIEASHVVPLDEDRYELDLVVDNLRGGHDAWDPRLLIQAGEIARDLGYALRIQPVISALSPGSPLDDLDEGLRAIEEGGVRGFFARRRVRRIDAQTTAALGWRTIIGKISAAVDWRN